MIAPNHPDQAPAELLAAALRTARAG